MSSGNSCEESSPKYSVRLSCLKKRSRSDMYLDISGSSWVGQNERPLSRRLSMGPVNGRLDKFKSQGDD